MIDDLALLKQAMEQMDAEDPTVAQAAKDRAAQTLSDARLSFAKMAELIEQRRLLLRPRIVASIKRMDQPGMLGEAAFRDAGSALRKEGQSFRQIAEAIEHTGRPPPPYEDTVQESEPLHQMASEPGRVRLAESARFCCAHCFLSAATSAYGFSRSHSSPFFCSTPCGALSPWASTFRDISMALRPSATARIRRRRRWVLSSMSTSCGNPRKRRAADAARPNPVSSSRGPVVAVRSPVGSSCYRVGSPRNRARSFRNRTRSFRKCIGSARTALRSSRTSIGCPCGSSGFNAASRREGCTPFKVGSEPWRGAGGGLLSLGVVADAPSEDNRPRALEDIIPEGMRRSSRVAGPCIGGIGGCYWGGGRY